MLMQTRIGSCTWIALLALVPAIGQAQPASPPSPPTAASTDRDDVGGEARTLRFSFERTPWRAVLSWVAEEAGLALYISELPTGSFTYSDPNSFTPAETIDRINLFLIPQGVYVRSQR